jgi:hypothetical protein
MRFNDAGVNHIRVELNHALMLIDTAKLVDSKAEARHLVAEASSAYCSAMKLIPRVLLTDVDAQEIDGKRLRLNSLLQEVGSSTVT